MSGPVIPCASRPFESPMTLPCKCGFSHEDYCGGELCRAESPMPFPIANRRATVPAYPSLNAAGADVAEADPAQRVAADPSVIDAERHPLYGHGVESHGSECDCLICEPLTDWEVECDAREIAEHVRQSRLSRWQEQR